MLSNKIHLNEWPQPTHMNNNSASGVIWVIDHFHLYSIMVIPVCLEFKNILLLKQEYSWITKSLFNVSVDTMVISNHDIDYTG